MAILFHCHCGQRLKAPDDMAGRRAKCFQCGAAVRVPEPFLAPSHEPPPEPPRDEPVDLGVECDEEVEVSPTPSSSTTPTKPMRQPGRWYYPVLVASNLVSFVLGAALVFVAARGPSQEAQFERLLVHTRAASNPVKLADLELMRPVSDLEPIVDQFREQLRKADRMFAQDEDAIVVAISKVVLTLRASGRHALPSEVLETLVYYEPRLGDSGRGDVEDWILTYALLRQPRASHTWAAMNFAEVNQAFRQAAKAP